MFQLLEKTITPLSLNTRILEVAYELYLQAPQQSEPVIPLRHLADRTGASLLECRNTIVAAHRVGRFPPCTLEF